MRLLCLHGRWQTGGVLAGKLFPSTGPGGAAKAALVGTATTCSLVGVGVHGWPEVRVGGHELVFPNGPLKSTPQLKPGARAVPNACVLYSWWEQEVDVAKALESVAEYVNKLGPSSCDGVLGFSQGGALAAYLCRTPSPLKPLGVVWRPKVAVLLNAYTAAVRGELPNSTSPSYVHDGLSSLHVWGRNDQVVSPVLSQTLCTAMHGESHILEHGAGHSVPPPPFGTSVLVPWLDAHQQQQV